MAQRKKKGERAPPWPPCLLRMLAPLASLAPLLLLAPTASAQEPLVVLRQGTLRGIRVFTETRQPISAFLGVPYAAPPIGDLRFSAPERHAGWNGSLFAGSWRPACPQPLAPAAVTGPALTDEDCLTLNIWAPDAPHYRPLPVVVLFEGQEFVSGAPQRFPGYDLAAEGLVVVSISYRLNVFGFFSLGDAAARGNLGLLDQYVALLWVRENIALFRGDPNAVTLMGHGAGAAAVTMHLASPRTAGLFQRTVLMSGSAASPWTSARPASEVTAASRGIARKLGCAQTPAADSSAQVLACLRAKPQAELLRAFEAQYQNGNWSELVGPVVEDFLPEGSVYLPRDPLDVLAKGGAPVPVLTGVTSAEGTLWLNQWGELARQDGSALRRFLEQSALPQALERFGLLRGRREAGGGAGGRNGDGGDASEAAAEAAVRALAAWRYAEATDDDAEAVRSALLQLLADTRVLAGHRRVLRTLARGAQPVFAYAFTQPGAPDPFAPAPQASQQAIPQQQASSQTTAIRDISGAAHGSDLLFLLGPTALVQAARRRPTPAEERLGKRLKRLWAEFAHRGEPAAGGFGYGFAWRRYTGADAEWAELRDATAPGPGPGPGPAPAPAAAAREADAFWNSLLSRMRALGATAGGGGGGGGSGATGTPGPQRAGTADAAQPFRSATYALLAFVVALLALLVACAVLLKRRARERERDLF